MTLSFGKARSAKRVKFRRPSRGVGKRGSKYDVVIQAILELEVDSYLPIEVPEGVTIDDFRASWAQMLSSKVRKALIEKEGVSERYEMSKDFEAVFIDGVDNQIAILCVENDYTEEEDRKVKARTAKALASRKAGKSEEAPKTTKPAKASASKPAKVEDEDVEEDIEF
jgi:hypothetical protein